MEGSVTEHGGIVVQASSSIVNREAHVAVVGDGARYLDGTVARIMSGAGAVMINHGRTLALVDSELDNRDRILGPHRDGLTPTDFADGERIARPFDRHYVTAQFKAGLDG